jgi:surface-anchored protein
MKFKSAFLTIPALLAVSQPVSAASFITGGHVDAPAFGYTTLDGFEPHIHNEGGPDGVIIDGVRETNETEYESDELTIYVRPSSTITVGPTTYYWMPETETAASANDVAFLGFGLEELDIGDWVGGTVTLTLLGITGPGEFRMWQDDGFGGANDFIDTDGGPMSFTLAAGSHTHFNWGFTELGDYELEWGISGTHQTDGPQSGSASFLYAVPEPSAALLAGFGLLACLRRRR